MRPSLHIALMILAVLTAAPAASSAADDSQAAVRARMDAALTAAEQGRIERAMSLSEDLQDHPLYSYIRYHDLRRRLGRAPLDEIARFLTAYDGSLLAAGLRRRALEVLAERERWADYIKLYRPQNATRLQCLQLKARVATGQLEGVAADARSLWLVGESQPPECDPAFEILYASPLMSDDLVWQRIRLALANGDTGLAGYLARTKLADAATRQLAEAWIEAHRTPRSVLTSKVLSKPLPRVREIALHAVARESRSSADAGRALWRKLRARSQYSEVEQGLAQRAIAVAAASQDHADRLKLLDEVNPYGVDSLVERYRLREGLHAQAWPQLARWTFGEPRGDINPLRWRYWHGRALEAMGEADLAKPVFERLSRERDYYGFLAADRLGVPYQMNFKAVAPSPAERSTLVARPGLRRISELIALDRPILANREWFYETGRMAPRELEVAAALMTEWGSPHRAIMALGRARSYDDLEVRFPLLHRPLVDRYATKRELEPAVIYSIIRTESAFLSDARSPAGALGLMQLMPATGRETARRIGLPLANPGELLRPDKNITLGSAYLKQMLDRFDGNFSMAAAAYNAGPYRVRQWRPKKGCLAADIWIDSIPFTETRRYVRRALFHAAVYDWRLEQPVVPLAERLRDVRASGTSQC